MKNSTTTIRILAVAGIFALYSPIISWADDDARPAAANIRKLAGKHIILYSDIDGEEIDRLPEIFDQAFPQWCRYFGVDQNKHADWRMTGFVMKDKDRFVAAGFLPGDLPPFPHGYSRGDRLWLYEQPTDFYRRELFLHEGTHGFMNTLLGGCGPPWYMEGMAEYCGTHRLENGRLNLGYMPRGRDEAPGWGRVRIIQDAVAEGRLLSLDDVLDMPPTAHRVNEPYAWCWAAVTLLDRHPRYRDRFRGMIGHVRDRDFNARFRRLFTDDWRELGEEWRLMVSDMEYGYDVACCAVDFTPAKTVSGSESDKLREITVAADRGWQNSGLRLEAGKTYRLTASGRFQIAATSAPPEGNGLEPHAKIWWCEPGGVSIRYYKDRPLGMLLAAVRPDQPAEENYPLLNPAAIGLNATITPAETGTLFLKVNDSPGELHDNAGRLKVLVRMSSDIN